jgi:hypothetical protein
MGGLQLVWGRAGAKQSKLAAHCNSLSGVTTSCNMQPNATSWVLVGRPDVSVDDICGNDTVAVRSSDPTTALTR